MERYIEKLKTTLYDLIREMAEHYWLYVSDPNRNFSRDRKAPRNANRPRFNGFLYKVE